MKISFVILTWNSEKYIKDCVDSILDIKKINLEIIIVDNGSSDSTINIIKTYTDERIKIIQLEKNYGTTISRNKGLSLIKNTDYICVLDSDTVINENAVNIMCNYLKNNPETAIVGPAMCGIDKKKQIPYRKFPSWKIKLYKAIPIKKINQIGERLEQYDASSINEEFECDYLISACWMLRYEIYKKLGDLDEKIFYSPEDVEYCLRARNMGYKIIHLKNAQIIHAYQRISKKKLISKANFTHILGLYYVLNKYKKFLKKYRKN